MTGSMELTCARYDVAEAMEIVRHCVEDDELAAFADEVRGFVYSLGTDVGDPYWSRIVARLRRVRWQLATVPLPLNHPALELADTSAVLERWMRDCDRLYPSHAAAAAAVMSDIAALRQTGRDALGERIADLQHARDGIASAQYLLLRDVRYVVPVMATLRRRGVRVDVIVPSQLASSRVCDRMIVVGPAAAFPRYVFAAPNARRIDLVHFGWIRDGGVDTGILPEGKGSGFPRYLLASHEPLFHRAVDAADLTPLTDWASIAAHTGGAAVIPDVHADMVDAYLLLLASGDAVYLAAEEGSRAYTVELSGSRELHQVPTSAIGQGSYLVIRVGGDGDYIPAIANALLGGEAPALRTSQQLWKDKLRTQIAHAGLQTVARRITEAGSSRANMQNVRRWASSESIRTSDFADFEALMKVLGLEDAAQQLWRDMDRIDQAHLRAGQRVRALLNHEVLRGDTSELERSGWRDYDVAEIDGEGALRVARVEARAPGTVRIPARQTRRLISLERDLWSG